MKSAAIALALALAAISATPALAALKPGEAAPAFTAPAYLAGQPFNYKLADALKKGPVVLYFFPSAYTEGCNIEAHLFSEAAADYNALGATIIGVTAGKTAQLAEFSKDTKTCGGKFPVAADPDLKIAKSYEATFAPGVPVSNRTSYVIAPNGKVVFAYSNLSASDHVNQTLTAVKALKGVK